jgi:methylated-DNA-[protein]-cysteine S-methyltransferase
MATHHRIIDSPIGELTLVGYGETLTGVYYPGHWTDPDRATFGPERRDILGDAVAQLREYFGGGRTAFDLDTRVGGSPFQREVWSLIGDIPYGETRTYTQLAAELDRVSHPRAVGTAVGANPLSLIVPCHRVVGSSGRLTGYAGGLERKEYLLAHEGIPVAAGALNPQRAR